MLSNLTCFAQIILLIMVISSTTGCTNMRSMAVSDSRYGTRCITIGLWHDAKFHLEKAIKNNPGNIFTCNNLGVVYEYFGDNKAAKCLYEKAVSIIEEGTEAQLNPLPIPLPSGEGEKHKGTKAEGTEAQSNSKSSSFTRLLGQSCYQNLKDFMEETGQTGVGAGSKPALLSGQGTVSASKKILSKRVEIQKKLPPILNIDGINNVGILVLLSDEKAEEITKRIVEAFKERIQEESSFYINEEILQGINELPLAGEVAPLTGATSSAKDKPVSEVIPLSLSLQNPEAIIDLCASSGVQWLFALEIMEFNDKKEKMITTKSRYSEEERRYIYYDIPSINRKVTLKIRFCFLEAKTSNLLWDKKYDISKVKEYFVEDEEKIPLYDMELFENLCNEPASNFISATKPQYKCSKRQVLIEK